VKHYANLSGVSVPSNLGTLIQSIRGLDDFKPQNHSHRLSEKATPQYTAAPGIYGLVPGDIATIYDIQALYNAGVDGTGVTAAVVGQSDIDLADITAYRNTYNLPNNLPTVVLVAGSPDPGISNGDLIEADLDLEVLGAVARNAKLVYVNSTNAFTSLEYAIDQNLAQIISMSFGSCEANVSIRATTRLTVWAVSGEVSLASWRRRRLGLTRRGIGWSGWRVREGRRQGISGWGH
jgi:subtilase family serine protease